MPRGDYEKQTIRHIAGNVGRAPERKPGREEATFATFSVAVTRDYDDDAKPRWYGVSVNREALQDDVMRRIKKGSRVVCEGIPSTKQGDNGQTFYNFKAFRVGLVEYLGLGGNTADDDDDEDDDWEDDDDL
jgi:single-stranded DNA-binding protein